MIGSDKWFRWSLNVFVFLICFQLGMLLFLKGLFYQAEKRMKTNEAKVSFVCGDFNNDQSYWHLPESRLNIVHSCQDVFCPESLWINKEEQSSELHVLSVVKARPTQKKDGKVESGHFVDVKFEVGDKPITLALVSQSMMQWNLKLSDEQKDKIKEIIVIGPDLVWIDGVDESKVTYFSKEQLCAFPTAWEELANSENQFRRLYRALNQYTGLNISSFQGKNVGREFKVPFKSLLAEERTKNSRSISSEPVSSIFSLGIQWKREGKTIKADKFNFMNKGMAVTVNMPANASDGFFEHATQSLFVINNHQFGTWDWQNKVFKAIHLPLKLPALYWPTALAFNPLKSEIYIYNDDRGGEVLSFNVVTKQWQVLAKKVGYSLVALHFDREKELILGTRFKGQKIASLVKIDTHGKIVETQELSKAIEFSKNRWRAKMMSDKDQVWLKVTHPAHPGGDVYPLSGT